MFKRVMVAVVGIPLLLVILGWAPEGATMVLTMGMCAVGAWELMHAVRGERAKSLIDCMTWAPILMAAVVPWKLREIRGLGRFLSADFQDSAASMAESLPEVSAKSAETVFSCVAELGAWVLAFLLVLFVCAILRYGTDHAVSFGELIAAIFAGAAFPAMLSCLLLLRMEENGRALVFLPLCISFGSDTFALFAGMLCGKHKLTPVSPKKTVEGAVGGLIGGVFGMAVFKLIAEAALSAALLDWTAVALFGIFGSVVGQIGDLSFSLIKREFGVKDYGNLLPGHGGILDRFDSVSFVAPFVWLLWHLV